MEPLVKDGDIVLYEHTNETTEGDIVFVSHPFMQSVNLLKRVREINAEGRLFLVGDNPSESTDSRTLGWFSPADLRGRVICRLK